MISDEERIAAAKALRERAKRPLGKSMQLMFSETLGLYRTNICWAKPTKATETWANIVNYLADLIDVPTAKGIIEDDGTSVCGHCGFRFDVSVEVAGCISEVVLANHCPQCGRLLVWCDEVDE